MPAHYEKTYTAGDIRNTGIFCNSENCGTPETPCSLIGRFCARSFACERSEWDIIVAHLSDKLVNKM